MFQRKEREVATGPEAKNQEVKEQPVAAEREGVALRVTGSSGCAPG